MYATLNIFVFCAQSCELSQFPCKKRSQVKRVMFILLRFMNDHTTICNTVEELNANTKSRNS